MSDITLSQLIEAGVHLGHKTCRWNPKMLPYIYAEVNNTHIIDLVQSAKFLKKANAYLESAARKGKSFLFIGTKRQASALIAQEAKRCHSFYVNHHWLGGTLTNWSTLKKRILYLKDLEKQETDNIFDLLPKKEATLRRKELQKLSKNLDGIKTMAKLPDVAIVIGQKEELTAIHELKKLQIPIVSILDTNCDPDLVDVPIPGNDDATQSLKLILSSLTNSIIAGKMKTRKK